MTLARKIGIAWPKTRSRRIHNFCEIESHTEYPAAAIIQCQINSYDVMLNSRGRLGKHTSDLKITFVEFTFPTQRPYIPSLSLIFNCSRPIKTQNKPGLATELGHRLVLGKEKLFCLVFACLP